MGYNKITNLLGKLDKDEIPKFTTIKWIEIFDQSNRTYNPYKDTRFKTPQIRDDLCDFNDAYMFVIGKTNARNTFIPSNAAPPNGIYYSAKISSKNSAPFFNCALKINNQLIEDAEDIDIVRPMYNLLYYSKNFRKTTGSFWNYYPDIPSSRVYGNNNERTNVYYPIQHSEIFDYKIKLVGELDVGNNVELPGIKTIVPLKNLSNFISNLKFLMINTEIELILKWSQNCALTEKVIREGKDEIPAQDGNAAVPAVVAINTPSDLKFNITDCKLNVPVVTLQEKYENKLLEDLKTGIDINFEWKRYRTQFINQPVTNNLNVLTDPTFNNMNRLFVLAFPNEENRSSFSLYYTPTVEIKDYNVLIDLQPFYDMSIKNKEQLYEAITELMNHDNYTTGDSLTYEYFCNHYKLITIDLSKQNSDFKNQQINFVGKL